ncbi:L-aspartate oxidase [Alcaligenes faecalis]|uniref:L-aspartate oxidase n=1 Tax=Alcaligenes faecalis TaxID=511 RepID=UPI001C9B8A3E|nr:L-aspartate oxidase [Alcaligenes faecalis]MBY6310416.1 L-aspartate oxidase [Alcaligenes faecalis]MBY6315901.1 L-aspartate oxidase [Alcaligenes faecalis]MBY6390892.1 L-aspartate oxidase [Alcaligenes faecalis]
MQSGSTQTDVLIIGVGLAGTSLALSLPSSMNVTLLSSAPAPCGASPMALGGLAAVLSAQDSLEQHIEDTLEAGARHSDKDAVRGIVQAAPDAVHWLLERQVPLDRTEDGQLHLTREGGHSQRRIVHAADASGSAIMQALVPQLAQASHIQQRTDCLALALRRNEQGTVAGVDIYDKHTRRYETILADHVVLATGGLGSLYAHSTNPDSALGEGIALAWRAGAAIRDLEFVQFHPTCLHAEGPTFLLTEALRGEGGHLLDKQGRRFMPDYDARGELAPRDIVSRAIAAQMRREASNHVWLDVRHLGAETLQQHFPKALEEGLRRGLDLRQDWVPVAPAAHYSCGGIETDLSGRTTVAGLYAVGEVACTGLHGANRLASNSLLECVVMGRAAAEAIARSEITQRSALAPETDVANTSSISSSCSYTNSNPNSSSQAGVGPNWGLGLNSSSSSKPSPRPSLMTARAANAVENIITNPPSLLSLRNLMQEHVGLLRNRQGLVYALRTLEDWREQIRQLPGTQEQGSLSLQLDTAWLLTQAALARPHSLGAHFRVD